MQASDLKYAWDEYVKMAPERKGIEDPLVIECILRSAHPEIFPSKQLPELQGVTRENIEAIARLESIDKIKTFLLTLPDNRRYRLLHIPGEAEYLWRCIENNDLPKAKEIVDYYMGK